MLRRVFGAVWRSVIKVGLRWLPLEDPWEPAWALVPTRRFGTGSVHNFRWYFQGASSIPIRNLEEVCDWLCGCRYTSDRELFAQDDLWQHPLKFEELRQGDCEDHALWAWRKLVELGYRAELVSGECRRGDGSWGGHVWVCFERDGQRYLLEAVAKDQDKMVRPLDSAKTEYCPNVAVASDFGRSGFHGYLHTLKRRLFASTSSAA